MGNAAIETIKKILILVLVVLLSVGSAFSSSFPYSGDITGGVIGGEENWDTYIDLVLPLAGNDKSFFFISPRASMTGESIFDSASHEFNIGAGYRAYFENIIKGGAVIGANIYYDSRNSNINNNYQQAGIGLEFLSKRIDFRANAYIPFGNNDYYLGKSYNVFENNNIAATYYYEVAMRGFDSEIGWNLPLPQYLGEFRIFAGYYHFVSDTTGSRYQGLKGKAEYKPINILSLNASVFQYDNFTGSQWQAGAAISLPFHFVKMLQGKNPFSGIIKYIKTREKPVKDRMGEIVQRDMYVRVYTDNNKRFDDVVSDEDGYPYHFTVVSPGGSGDGTFKNPAALNAGVEINKNVSGNNAVLLLLGGSYDLSSGLYFGGHSAKNVLVTGPQEMIDRGVDLSLITSGNPVINVFGAITAFNVDPSGTESFSVTSIEFGGSAKTGTALEIVNNQNDFYIGNNSFSNFETGMKVESSSGSVYAFNNMLKENNTGAELTGKNILFEQNIISGNSLQGILVDSGEDINISLSRFENNGYGINFNNSANSLVYKNELKNNALAAVNSINSDEIVIHENLIENNKKDGIFLSGGTEGEVSKNKIYNNLENGINVSNTSGTIVSDNETENNLFAGISASDNINFYASGNQIKSNKGNGFKIIGADDITIYDNEISSNTESGLYIENSGSVDVINNRLSFNGENGIYGVNVSSGYMSGNISANNESAGMYFDGLFDSSVVNSTAQANKSHGMIFNNSANIEIINNRSRENLADGIHVDSGTFVYMGYNRSTANEGNGLYFKGVSVSTFNVNYFEESGGLGGYFENILDMLMQQNYFVENKDAGAKFININEVYLTGNMAEINEKDGMYFENADNTIVINNKADLNKENGFHYVSGTDTMFHSNLADDNSAAGIYIESGSGMTVAQNVIRNNKEEGLRAVNVSTFSAYENNITSNTGGGIYVSGIKDVEISSNSVLYNGGFGGIYGKDFSGSVNIEQNTVAYNAGTGISVINSSGAVVKKNRVDNNAGLGGIYVENFKNGLLDTNSAYYNESAGITVKDSANVNIKNNGTYYRNSGHGIYLTNVSSVSLDTNFIQKMGVSDKTGLYLKGAVTFETGFGNNNFIGSAFYGGDNAPVLDYETNVMINDNFY